MKKFLFLVLAVTLMVLVSTKVFAQDAFPEGRVAAMGEDKNMLEQVPDSGREGLQGAVTSLFGATAPGTPLFPNTPKVNSNAACPRCLIKRNLYHPGDDTGPGKGTTGTGANPGAEGVTD